MFLNTTDLGLAAWLIANGHPWSKIEKQGRVTRFFFLRDEELTQLMNMYLSHEGRDAKALLRAYKQVRAAAGI